VRKPAFKKILIGRNEWCQIPGLNLPAIKAKIDTGAKTSSIHAFNIVPISKGKQKWVNFDIRPIQRNENLTIACSALVVDKRLIMSSNGHRERRYIIMTSLKIADQCWDIELSLSNRDPLRFRMLLGREALNGHVLIDPSLSCYQGAFKKKYLSELYGINI
jgi:ribosomal protein S6--L-glutamate ligase